jgi:hypothetical protein
MPATAPTLTTGKHTVEVEHLPVKLIEVLEAFLTDIKERNGGFAKISIEVVEGRVKRFECTQSFVVSAL